jgi:hypothetical protein
VSASPEIALAVAAALLAISLLAVLLRRDPRFAILLGGGAAVLAIHALSSLSEDPATGQAWAVVAAIFLVAGLVDRRDEAAGEDDG